MRAELLLQGGELEVIRPETVAPFGDTMGFIDHEKG